MFSQLLWTDNAYERVLTRFSIQLEYANGFVVIWIVAFISSLTVIILDLS